MRMTKKSMLEVAEALGYGDIVSLSNKVSRSRVRDIEWHAMRLRRVEAVRALYKHGLSFRNIGELLGISAQRARNIMHS